MRNLREISTCAELRQLLIRLLETGDRECSLPRAFGGLVEDLLLRLDVAIDLPWIEVVLNMSLLRTLDDATCRVSVDHSRSRMTRQSAMFLKAIVGGVATGVTLEKMHMIDAATSALRCSRGLQPTYVGNRLWVHSSPEFERRFKRRVKVDLGYDIMVEPFSGTPTIPGNSDGLDDLLERSGKPFGF